MKYFSFRSQQVGFSLIELLMIIAVISVMSVIMIVSVSANKEKKDVGSVADFVASRFREAQVSALTGQQYAANTTPCAYRVAWGSGQVTNSYMAKDGSDNCTNSTTITGTPLPSGVTFSGVGAVDFVLPHGKIATDQVITLQKGSTTKVICVGTDGSIRVEDSASSC